MVRTTVEIDEDLADKLRRLAHKRGTSLRAVMNETLRRGLSSQEPRRAKRARYRVKPFDSAFRPGVDPERLNQLVDEIEIRDRTGR